MTHCFRKSDVQSQYYSPHPDQYPDLINVSRYNTLQQQSVTKRKTQQYNTLQRDYSSLQRQTRNCKTEHFSIKQHQNNNSSNHQQYFPRQTDFSDCITPPPPPLDWQSPDPDPQSYSGGTNEV